MAILTKKKKQLIIKESEGKRSIFIKKAKDKVECRLVSTKETKKNPREAQRSVGHRTLAGYRKA